MIVMKMGHVTRAMVKEAHDVLAQLPCKKLGIVLTNFEPEGAGYYRQRYYREYSTQASKAGAISSS